MVLGTACQMVSKGFRAGAQTKSEDETGLNEPRQFGQLWGVLVALGGLPQTDDQASSSLWEQEKFTEGLQHNP